jgi:hypothetical protein
MAMAGHPRHEREPVGGWACLAVGVGYVAVFIFCLVLVLNLAQ